MFTEDYGPDESQLTRTEQAGQRFTLAGRDVDPMAFTVVRDMLRSPMASRYRVALMSFEDGAEAACDHYCLPMTVVRRRQREFIREARALSGAAVA